MQCFASPLGSFESRFFRATKSGVLGGSSIADTHVDLDFPDVGFSYSGVTPNGSGNWILAPGTYFIEVNLNLFAVGHAYLRMTAGSQTLYGQQVYCCATNAHQIQYRECFKLVLTQQTNMSMSMYTEFAVADCGMGGGANANTVLRSLHIWRLY